MNNPGDSDKTRIKVPVNPNNDVEDKTRFAPPKKPQPASVEGLDKTRLKTPLPGAGADKTRVKSATTAVENADKTRVVPPRNVPRPDERPDKTRFIPRRPAPSPAVKREVKDPDVTRVAPEQPVEKNEPASEYGIIKNRFVFEELLGAGGMGVVYKAKDLLKVEAQDRDPYVAIKVLSDEFKAHPEAFIALQRESRKTQRIAHPNIVNVHDFDRDGDTVFMTMEYLDGKPLDKLISQYRSIGLPTEEVWKILNGICSALIYAHGQHIIHSDFKPGNIFVNTKGVAKVFDFGIARAVAKAEHREESHDDRTVFDAGNLGALTPAYASLEMLEGKTPDVRDDIYALGCIAYELFTGEHPYNRVHADEAKRQKLKPKRIPGLTKNQWRAIERSLAFDREDRTESVEAFWEELNRKSGHTGKIVLALLVLLALAGGAYYKYKPVPEAGLSEDQVRSQIEQQLRREMKMQAVTDLYASALFTPPWEKQLWDEVQELRQLLGKDDTWLVEQESNIYQLYLKQIEQALTEGALENAQLWTVNAGRYTEDKQTLEMLEARIAQALEDKKRFEEEQEKQRALLAQEQQRAAKEAQIVAERRSAFEVGLENVNKQLACRSNIDMKDFEIAITKLQSLDSARYKREEPRITRSLAQCIERIGSSFPERGEAAKVQAMRLFRGNATIAGIRIVPKDPCSTSLAGLGARGMGTSCRDRMSGVSKAPAMVVIPGKGSIKTFAIGKYEVMIDEFNEFCQSTKSCTANTSADRSLPATNISLANANAYLKWLSDKSGRRYRLPTLAEWQYAAKANTGRVDPNRNCKLNSRGIQKGNALIKATIGQQNAWGMVNYLGNAREWVNDRGSHLAVGGSFETAMEECSFNNSTRHEGNPDAITGFRVLREIDG